LPLAKKLVDENYRKNNPRAQLRDLLRILANARRRGEPLDLSILTMNHRNARTPECLKSILPDL